MSNPRREAAPLKGRGLVTSPQSRSLAPNRLFTSCVDGIKREKAKVKRKTRGSGDSSHPGETPDGPDGVEVSEASLALAANRGAGDSPPPHRLSLVPYTCGSASPGSESASSTNPQLEDREEPSGAEDDDGEVTELEDIRVQVTTTIVLQEETEQPEEEELSPVVPKQEAIEVSPVEAKGEGIDDLSPVSSTALNCNSPCESDSNDLKVVCDPSKSKKSKKKKSKRSKDVEASVSDDETESSSSVKSRRRLREQSVSPRRHRKKHQTSPEHLRSSSSCRQSKSRSRERSKKKHHSSSEDVKSEGGGKWEVRSRDSDSDLYRKTKNLSDGVQAKNYDPSQHVSRSVTPVKSECSDSLDASSNFSETSLQIKISHNSSISNPQISCLNQSDTSEAHLSTASPAPDFIPLSRSYQGSYYQQIHTPSKMTGASETNYLHHGSPQHAHLSSPSLFQPHLFSTPPPSHQEPPTMHGGLFQWVPPPVAMVQPPIPGVLTFPIPPPPIEKETDRRYLRLQNLHTPPKPSFNGYQLIGDSMLLRFSQHLLGENAIVSESLRFLGYCVSGQRIGELYRRLKSGFYHVGKKVVLMIGTNDLLKNTHIHQMTTELRRVIAYLKQSVDKLIVLTLPPIPRLENYTHHWLRLNQYNECIIKMGGKDSGISVFNISPLYVLTKEELEEELQLVESKAESPFCHGCFTCMEDDIDWNISYESDEDENDWNIPTESDEDDIGNTPVLTRVVIRTSSGEVTCVDISNSFADRRIPKCRMDCFEVYFSDSGRKDMIHLNKKGFTIIREELYKAI